MTNWHVYDDCGCGAEAGEPCVMTKFSGTVLDREDAHPDRSVLRPLGRIPQDMSSQGVPEVEQAVRIDEQAPTSRPLPTLAQEIGMLRGDVAEYGGRIQDWRDYWREGRGEKASFELSGVRALWQVIEARLGRIEAQVPQVPAETHGLADAGRTQCGQPSKSLDVTEFPALVSCEACLLTMAPPVGEQPESDIVCDAATCTRHPGHRLAWPASGASVEERTEEDCPDLGIGDHDCITHAAPEIQLLAQALRSFADRIAQAIGDPGSIVGRKRGPSWGPGEDGFSESEETVTRWSTRAVLHVLTESNVAPPSAEGFSGGTAALRVDVVTKVVEEVEALRRELADNWQIGTRTNFAVIRSITAHLDRIASAVKGEQQ